MPETDIDTPDDVVPPEAASALGSVKSLSGARKAAILLIAMGSETASKVLKYMNDDEVEQISIEIARCRNLSSDQVEGVLLEYKDMALAQEYITQGGVSFARKTLEAALGPIRAEEIMMRVEAAMEVSAFHLLQTVETSQLANFLVKEHPQTSALILSHLNPRKAADIIGHIPSEVQTEIMFRLATMGKTSPELLRDIEDVIRQQMGVLFGTEMSNTGGVEAVAQILNNSSRTSERTILDSLRERDNDLATSIKSLMFGFEDLVQISDRDLQRLLVEVEQRDLALAMKAASGRIKEKIITNLSDRAGQMLEEEIDLMGPVRVSDVDDAQRRIIEIAQALEEQEEIVLSRVNEDMVI